MLNKFIEQIEGFFDFSHGDKIVIFGYYQIFEKQKEFFSASEIRECYAELLLVPYANIPSFLSKNSIGRDARLLKKSNGFILSRSSVLFVQKIIKEIPEKTATNNLIDLELFSNTRGYLEKTFAEACRCYDEKLFTSSLVMIRKGLEIMIIDLYEKRGGSELKLLINATTNIICFPT